MHRAESEDDDLDPLTAWLMTPGAPELPGFDRPAWMESGACNGHDTAVFFPERGQDVTAAKAICATCPVREPCLAYALADPHLEGVWAGTGRKTRAKLRRGVRPQPFRAEVC